MKHKGFTIVELLVAIGILMILVGIVVPAAGTAKTFARKMVMRANLHTIEIGLELFKNDQQRYPSSSVRHYYNSGQKQEYSLLPDGGIMDTNYTDIGAHRLAEAMFGVDMSGYSKQLAYEANYYNVNSDKNPCDQNGQPTERSDLYVDISSVTVGKMTDAVAPKLMTIESRAWDNPHTPVILDNFNKLPVLYYKADVTANIISQIYEYGDNSYVTALFDVWSTGDTNYDNATLKCFPNYIYDSRTGTETTSTGPLQSFSARPYRRDSFLLVTAGPDGEYGTQDDICNFTQKTKHISELGVVTYK